LVALIAAGGLALPAFAPGSGSVAAAAQRPSIRPGVKVTFGGVTCIAGPILRQGRFRYVAVPASCGGIDQGQVQDGCVEAETPLGVPVHIQNAPHRGILVYNSFSWMQLHGVRNPTRCYYNDLALIRIDPRDNHLVSDNQPGLDPPRHVSRRNPKSGSMVNAGSSNGTAGSTHHHGWELDITIAGQVTKSQLGTAVVKHSQVIGMLTVVPQGLVPIGTSQVYSLNKSLALLHRVRQFRRVSLLPG
jgi:hypothetical protein